MQVANHHFSYKKSGLRITNIRSVIGFVDGNPKFLRANIHILWFVEFVYDYYLFFNCPGFFIKSVGTMATTAFAAIASF